MFFRRLKARFFGSPAADEKSQPNAIVTVTPLKELREIIDNSSDKNRNLFLSFLIAMGYIFSVVAGISDVDLLLIDSHPTMTHFNISLSLSGFLVLAPWVLIVFHFYILIHLKDHKAKLQRWFTHPEFNLFQNKNQLSPFLMNQWAVLSFRYYSANMAGPAIKKTGDLRLIAYINDSVFALFPVTVLFSIFWKISTLQDWVLTSWHFITFLCSLGLVGRYWLSNRADQWGDGFDKKKLHSRFINNYLVVFALLAIMRMAMFIPTVVHPVWLKQAPLNQLIQSMIPHLDVAGLKLNQSSQPKLANNANAIAAKSINCGGEFKEILLQDRSLNFINFTDAIVCNVNFNQAQLFASDLSHSIFLGDFTNANLARSDLTNTILIEGTKATQVNLRHSRLHYAVANDVDFTLGDFGYSEILASEFNESSFIQAKFDHTQFIRGHYDWANFIGADFLTSQFTDVQLNQIDLRFSKGLDSIKFDQHSRIGHCLADTETLVSKLNIFTGSNCLEFRVAPKISYIINFAQERLKILHNNFDSKKFEIAFDETVEDIFEAGSEDIAQKLISAAEKTHNTALKLDYFGLTKIPTELLKLKHITELSLNNNNLDDYELGLLFTHMPQLQKVSIKYNETLTSIPAAIGRLTDLQTLDLSSTRLTGLPAEFGQLKQLVKLNLSKNKFTTMPKAIGQLTNLKELQLADNQLTDLTAAIGGLSSLTYLDIQNNQLTVLPESLTELKKLVYLTLTNNKLTELPVCIGSLNSLQMLLVGQNQLTALPDSVGLLTQLENLALWNNQLTTLPPSIGYLNQLRRLNLERNNLKSLPDTLNQPEAFIEGVAAELLTNLQPVAVDYNQHYRTMVAQCQKSPEPDAGQR